MANVLHGVQRLLRSLVPRERDFFVLFKQHTQNLLVGAQLLDELMADYSNLDDKVAQIDEIEDRGDEFTHQIIRQLNATFVTPIMLDREDIIHLADMIDNIVDYTKAVIDRLHLYEIERPTRYARRMARLFLRCAESLDEIIDCLRLLSSAADLEALQEQVKRINELENEADQVKRLSGAKSTIITSPPCQRQRMNADGNR